MDQLEPTEHPQRQPPSTPLRPSRKRKQEDDHSANDDSDSDSSLTDPEDIDTDTVQTVLSKPVAVARAQPLSIALRSKSNKVKGKAKAKANVPVTKRQKTTTTTTTSVVLPNRLALLPPLFASIATTLSFLSARNLFAIPLTTLQSSNPTLSLRSLRDLLAIAPNLLTAGYSDDNDDTGTRIDDVGSSPLKPLPSSAARKTLVVSLRDRSSIMPANLALGSDAKTMAMRMRRVKGAVQASIKEFGHTLDAFVAQHGLGDASQDRECDRVLDKLTTDILPDNDTLRAAPKPPRNLSAPSIPTLALAASTAAPEPASGSNDGPQQLDSVIDLFQSGIPSEPFFREQIVATHLTPAREPSLVPMSDLTPDPIHPAIVQGLRTTRNITHLYAHQVEGIRHLFADQHLVVTTSTASGKSLIYLIPILTRLATSLPTTARPRALYISPTKALAQDQVRSLRMLTLACPGLDWVQSATLDGDTPMADRAHIRANAHIIMTNPDMLHVTVLPNHHEWQAFWRALKYVVLDELHMYEGSFGSHVGWIVRRMLRVAAHYGNTQLVFVACSATIGNPIEHAQSLMHFAPTHLSSDASPTPARLSVIWNPPPLNPSDLRAGRLPLISETARLFVFLIRRNVHTVAFAKTRSQCELLYKEIVTLLGDGTPGLVPRVKAYRAGYAAHDRRKIERGLSGGEYLGVVATSALEVGVDIGGVDAVVHMGFMGHAALRQQAGRAGRRSRDCLSILVCSNVPLDQFYARHPERLFEHDTNEYVTTDLTHADVVEAHVMCAAYEVPIRLPVADSDASSDDTASTVDAFILGIDGVRDAVVEGLKWNADAGWYEATRGFPSRSVAIRAIDEDAFTLIDATNPAAPHVLEQLEVSRAMFSIYVGGIYLHQGQSYLVLAVSDERMSAKVRHTSATYFTRKRAYKDVDPVRDLVGARVVGPVSASYAAMQVKHHVYGFHKYDSSTHKLLESVTLSTPPIYRSARGVYMDIPPWLALELSGQGAAPSHPASGAGAHITDLGYAAIHAVNHALMHVVATVAVVGEGARVGTECRGKASTRPRPLRIIVYEDPKAGFGVAKRVHDAIRHVLETTLALIQECPCEAGCPECIMQEMCPYHNDLLSKAKAVYLLQRILENDEVDVGHVE